MPRGLLIGDHIAKMIIEYIDDLVVRNDIFLVSS